MLQNQFDSLGTTRIMQIMIKENACTNDSELLKNIHLFLSQLLEEQNNTVRKGSSISCTSTRTQTLSYKGATTTCRRRYKREEARKNQGVENIRCLMSTASGSCSNWTASWQSQRLRAQLLAQTILERSSKGLHSSTSTLWRIQISKS